MNRRRGAIVKTRIAIGKSRRRPVSGKTDGKVVTELLYVEQRLRNPIVHPPIERIYSLKLYKLSNVSAAKILVVQASIILHLIIRYTLVRL